MATSFQVVHRTIYNSRYLKSDQLDEIEPNKIYRTMLLTCPFLFASTILIMFSIIIGYQYQTDPIQKRNSLVAIRNLDTLVSAPLLKDFQMVAKNVQCPYGYVDQQIGQFEGVSDGCVCKDGTVHSYFYCLFSAECQYQSSVGKVDENVWNGHKVCILKLDMSKIKYLKAGQPCKIEYTRCSVDICSKDDKCPITMLHPNKNTKPRKKTMANDYFGNDHYVYHPPVIGFTTVQSKSKTGCLVGQYYQPKTESQKNYPAFKVPLQGCGQYGHALNQLRLETIAATTFEKENQLAEMFKGLQYYDKLMHSKTKNSYSLLSINRPYIKGDKKCQQGSSRNGVVIANYIDKYSDINLGFAIAISILCIVVIILTIVLIKQPIKNVHVIIADHVLAFVIGLLTAVYMATVWVYSMFQNISEHRKGYKVLVDNGCLPSEYNRPAKDMLVEVETFHDSIYWLGIVTFVIACVFVLIQQTTIISRSSQWKYDSTAILQEEQQQ